MPAVSFSVSPHGDGDTERVSLIRPRRDGSHMIDEVATTPMPRVDVTLHLSTRTLDWPADHPHARRLVRSVWDTLTELERSSQHPEAIDALRRVLNQASFIDHDMTWQDVAWAAVLGCGCRIGHPRR
jgi:hypothetical protein